MTVEELATRTGISVRDLREWQSLGLLSPRTGRGAADSYDSSHIHQVDRIHELREEGFSLKMVARILEREGAGGDALPFAQALLRPLHDESPEVVGMKDAVVRFKVDNPLKLAQAISQHWLTRSSKLGLVRARRDGRFEIVSPRLARLAEFMLELGFSMDEILKLGERVYRQQEEVAELFSTAFERKIFGPFERGKGSMGDWEEVAKALEELRPHALDAVEALFRIAMDKAAARAVEEKTGHSANRLRGPDSDSVAADGEEEPG